MSSHTYGTKGGYLRNQTLVRLKGAKQLWRNSALTQWIHLLPDEVTLQPTTERDNEKFSGPLGAGRVFQKDQACHCAAEVPGKTHNLDQSKKIIKWNKMETSEYKDKTGREQQIRGTKWDRCVGWDALGFFFFLICADLLPFFELLH